MNTDKLTLQDIEDMSRMLDKAEIDRLVKEEKERELEKYLKYDS